MFKRILLPIDGSSLSFKPVQDTMALVEQCGAKLVVLSIAEPRLYRASDFDSIQRGSAAETMRLESAQYEVDKVIAVAEEAGIDCQSLVFMSSDPAQEILDTALKNNCDLIVMATRGKMGVIDTIFGESTTQIVLQKSSVPVLVFP